MNEYFERLKKEYIGDFPEFSDYKSAVMEFRKDTKEWGDLWDGRHYTTNNGGWEESYDNAHGGFDVSWAFWKNHYKDIEDDKIKEEYIDCITALLEQGIDEEWEYYLMQIYVELLRSIYREA